MGSNGYNDELETKEYRTYMFIVQNIILIFGFFVSLWFCIGFRLLADVFYFVAFTSASAHFEMGKNENV